MLSLLIIVCGFSHVHSQCCSSANTYGTISCVDGSASLTANPRYNYYRFHFSTDKTEDVTVSTCDSDFDTVTHVYSTPTPSTPTWYPVSAPTCSDGDDCLCSRNEEYTLSDVPAGDYVAIVYGYPTSPTCSCSPPTSSQLTVSITGCTTPSPTLQPTSYPTLNTVPPTTAPVTTLPPTSAPSTTAPPTTASPTTASPTTASPTTATPTTASPTEHPTTSNPTPKPTPKPALILHSPSTSPTENPASVENTVSVTADTADATSNTPSSRLKSANVLQSIDNIWLIIFGGVLVIMVMVCGILVMYVWRKRLQIKAEHDQRHLEPIESDAPNIQLPATNAMQNVSSEPVADSPPNPPKQEGIPPMESGKTPQVPQLPELPPLPVLHQPGEMQRPDAPQSPDLAPLPPPPQAQSMQQPIPQQSQQQYALWMQQQQQQRMYAMMIAQQQLSPQQQQVQQRQLLGGFSAPGMVNAVPNVLEVNGGGEAGLMDDVGDVEEVGN